jgi:hypothetical protein
VIPSTPKPKSRWWSNNAKSAAVLCAYIVFNHPMTRAWLLWSHCQPSWL